MAPHSAESFGTASRNVRHHPKASSIAAAARRSPSGSFAASPASRHHRRVSARHLSTTESASSVARTPPKNVTVSALIPARASFIIRCAVRSGMPASRRNPDHSPCAATARASSSTSAHASQLSTDFRCSAPASCASSARTAPLFEAAIFLRCAVTSRNAHHRRSRAASQLATFRSQIQANGQHVGRHESARGIDPISSRTSTTTRHCARTWALQTALSRDESLASPSTLCRLENRANRNTAVALRYSLITLSPLTNKRPDDYTRCGCQRSGAW